VIFLNPIDVLVSVVDEVRKTIDYTKPKHDLRNYTNWKLVCMIYTRLLKYYSEDTIFVWRNPKTGKTTITGEPIHLYLDTDPPIAVRVFSMLGFNSREKAGRLFRSTGAGSLGNFFNIPVRNRVCILFDNHPLYVEWRIHRILGLIPEYRREGAYIIHTTKSGTKVYRLWEFVSDFYLGE